MRKCVKLMCLFCIHTKIFFDPWQNYSTEMPVFRKFSYFRRFCSIHCVQMYIFWIFLGISGNFDQIHWHLWFYKWSVSLALWLWCHMKTVLFLYLRPLLSADSTGMDPCEHTYREDTFETQTQHKKQMLLSHDIDTKVLMKWGLHWSSTGTMQRYCFCGVVGVLLPWRNHVVTSTTRVAMHLLESNSIATWKK